MLSVGGHHYVVAIMCSRNNVVVVQSCSAVEINN